MKGILLLITVVLYTFFTFGQRMRYEDKSNAFFGINAGNTWHTSDVRNVDAGLRGAGFLFGVSFNHDYQHAISFDLRFRYLGGIWYGQDTDTTGAIAGNNALNNVYGNLGGYAVQNFRASQHRAALELAIHFNSLRQRTGLDPYVFGGIGYTWTRVMGDLYNDLNEPYKYSETPSGNITQGNFDTPLDMDGTGVPYPTIDDADWRQSLLPSVGFGLGYFFTSRFSMGVEHKSTFFQDDYFDGTIVDQNGVANGRNDIYHYTSIYARWYLKLASDRNERRQDEVHTPPPPVEDQWEDTPIQHDPPRVVFTNPSTSPTIVSAPSINLRAHLTNVANVQNVFFRQDGAVNHNFTYVSSTGIFQSSVQLQPGENVFRLRGANQFGSDEATMVIIYEREELPTPPLVTITDPSVDPYVANVPNHGVRATIKNISNRSQVSLTVNGQSISDFDFIASGVNNFFTFVNLVPGPNTVRITGTNTHGTASDEVTIIYQRTNEEQLQQPPVVTYSNPVHSPITVSSPNFTITGSVLHVDSRNQVTFVQNGVTNNNFNYSTSSKQFSSSVVLQPGANIFQLIGTNSAGTDQKTVVINYDMPAPTPPIVTITRPSYQPHYTATASYSFKARVLNVDQKSQITVKLNGTTLSNFTYSSATKEVNASLSLVEGQNTVHISATNNDGSDSKSTVIVFEPPVTQLPPLVTYIIPETSPETTENEIAIISASVDHVNQGNQIYVTMNGVTVTDFVFNPQTNGVNFTRTLQPGANTVTITGTNEAGSDTKTTIIIYNKRDVGVPPVVTYIDPVNDPKTVYEATYNVKSRVQHVAGANNIALRINGVLSNNFTYSTSSEIMEFTTSLNDGANSIIITATNEFGSDVESTTIIYKRPEPVTPPIVTITLPVSDGYESMTSTTPVRATVLHVDDVNQIKVFVNGTQNYSFDYNYGTKQVDLMMPLQEGENKVRITAINQYGSDYDTRTIFYNPAVEVLPPFVEIIQPYLPGSIVTTPTYTFVGTVENIQEKTGIAVRFNGQEVAPELYSFNLASKEVRFATNLITGNNIFSITGTNVAGTHQANTTITYQLPEPECEDPIVAFVDPSAASTDVSESLYTINALVHNVASSQQITLLKNGQEIGNFNYNPTTDQLTRSVTLTAGNNVIELIAKTDCGRVSKSIILHYSPPSEACYQPIVSILRPTEANQTIQTNQVEFKGTVSNVETMQQVTLRINNSTVDFSFDVASHLVTANLELQEGVNTITLIGRNACGSDRKLIALNVETCTPPTSSLSVLPNLSNGKTEEETIRISGAITDILPTSVKVTNNGIGVNYIYNELQQQFSSEIHLQEGVNKIVVEGFSRCGTIQEIVDVTYTPVPTVEKPTVKITNPATATTVTDVATYTVVAKVTNIALSNQISVRVNQSTRNFQFNAGTGVVQFEQTLQEGNNSILITAVNEAGSASDQTVLIYKKPVTIDPPVVTFTDPSQATSSYEDGAYTIKGNATNINSRNQLELYINNQLIEEYQVTTGSDVVRFSIPLEVSSSHNSYTIRAKATNEAGSDQAMLSVRRVVKDTAGRVPGRRPGGTGTNNEDTGNAEETPCDDPTINLISAPTVEREAYNFNIQVNHVQGNNVSVIFNGRSINCSYNQARKEFSCNVDLEEGENEFIVTADGCSTTTKSFKVNYKPACKTISYQLVYPSERSVQVDNSVITLNLLVNHVTQAGVLARVNGNSVPVQLSGRDVILRNIRLNKGANTVLITLKNDCSSEQVSYTINYQEAVCGPYVNPGNAEWQFCMNTPSGTFSRRHIHNNPRFSYAGPASSVYFLAIAGGQDVTVNGKSYSIRSGVYYHFEGNLTVQMRWMNSRWMLCLDSDVEPTFGSGTKRPKSPCEPVIQKPTIPSTVQPSNEDEAPTSQPARPRRVIPNKDGDSGITSPTRPNARTRTISPSQPEEGNTGGDGSGTPLNVRRIGGRN